VSGADDDARAPWRPVDCHAHTTLSDGALDIDDMLAIVRRRGVRPSVSDHLTRDVAGAPDSVAAVRAYLDVVEARDTLVGGEFCWQDALWRELPDELWSRFTHRLGSLHAVFLDDGRMVRAFSRTLPSGMSPSGYIDALVANAERLAREMPVDILSHPTLAPLPVRAIPAEELWTDAHEERLVDALYDAGISFELSNRYRVHERLARRAVDRGVRLSLGSDGHTAEQVGDIAWPLALARKLGVRDEELYDPLVHGSLSLDARRGA
jgi:histidinol phosphatase-like PHP family hydrolase